jgi:hypothetical protein
VKRPFPSFFSSWLEILAIVALLILVIVATAVGLTRP